MIVGDIYLSLVRLFDFTPVFGTRTIVEESFIFKLSDQNVFVHDYSEYSVYEQDEVVTRAKSRIDVTG
jgi:hypothetical protein